MSHAIAGFGHVGQALAKGFSRKDIEVSVASTRDPESFASAEASIGPTIIPQTLAEAVKADIVFWPRSSNTLAQRRSQCTTNPNYPS